MVSAFAAIATAHPPSKVTPSASPTSSRIPSGKSPRRAWNRQGSRGGSEWRSATRVGWTRRTELLQKFPPSCARGALQIQGLGPKGIALLFEHFRITTLDELEQLCRDQKLRTLPRMGAKLEEKVLRSIAQHRERSGRFLLSFADNAARELTAYLADIEGVDAITPAGSLRRGRETIGDLDLLVTGPNAAVALDRVASNPRVHEVLGRGVNKTSVKLGREGLQVDVRALEHATFGAAMQYFTGSKEHNVALRQRAIRMGLKLSEYGMLSCRRRFTRCGRNGSRRVSGARTRLDSTRASRENNGGDRTRGSPSIAETGRTERHPRRPSHAYDRNRRARHARRNGQRLRALGYEYIAITDHSKAIAMSFGLDEKRAWWNSPKRFETCNESGHLGIYIFSGIECDIMKDGAMDLAWDALGGARYRDRQRPQQHESGAGGHD